MLTLQLTVACLPWCKLWVLAAPPFGFSTFSSLSPVQENQPPEGEPGMLYIAVFGLILSTGFCLTDLWSRNISKLYYLNFLRLRTQKDYLGLNFWDINMLVLCFKLS